MKLEFYLNGKKINPKAFQEGYIEFDLEFPVKKGKSKKKKYEEKRMIVKKIKDHLK